MPQLPSGRHIGILCLTPDEIAQKVSRDHPEVSLLTLGMKIKEINTLEAIKPFIIVMFFRETKATNDQPIHARSQLIPDGLEHYESGFTLADQEKFTADWPEEDKQAFTDFLQSERTVSYFQDVLDLMKRICTQYHQNLFGLIKDVCGGFDDAEDTDTACDDYDLLVALCIFADMAEPEELHKLDLWRRMNAIRRYWEEWIPALSKINKEITESPQQVAGRLRDKSALNSCPEDKREWMHQQNVVFANDLFDMYEPEVLIGINREAYGIVKSVALSEPSR